MINLKDINLVDILPPSVTSDNDIQALLFAIDRQLQQVSEDIINVVILPRIDELSESVVDYLAWQFHVDFYEPLGLSLEKKRTLVKNSIAWHRRKGTKSAVEEIIQLLCYEKSSVEEWFEYGGDPYYFRIAINTEILSLENINYLISAANTLKNVRSWLEGLIVTSEYPEKEIFLGTAITENIKSEMPMKPISNIELLGNSFIGGAIVAEVSSRIFDLQPIRNKNLTVDYFIGNAFTAVLEKREFDNKVIDNLVNNNSVSIGNTVHFVSKEEIPVLPMKQAAFENKAYCGANMCYIEYLEIPTREERL